MGKIEPREYELKTGEKVRVRSVFSGEATRVLEFVNSVWADPEFFITQPGERKLTEEQEEEWIKKHSETPAQLLLAAEVSSDLVGLLNLDTEDRKRLCHVGTMHISVLKEWRDRGVGAALIQALIAWAEKHPELEKLCLNVFANNGRAIHLYQKMGFREEGRRLKQFKLSPGEYVDEILMSRFVKKV